MAVAREPAAPAIDARSSSAYTHGMGFAPDYVRLVLAENFEDAKRLFLDPLLAIHRAHLVMLARQGIVSSGDAHTIRLALDSLDPAALRAAAFDGSAEDLYYHVDHLITAACGTDVAGRLHTARSRNDIDMTMYRMRQREALLGLEESVLALGRAWHAQAAANRHTVFAAHTHTQPAQPSTVAHFLLAAVEQVERDAGRLEAAYRSTNHCPLGACAITGTGFPIDRDLTSDLLGFDGPTGNTYGSIATADYLLEGLSAAAVLLVGVGRVLQDLLLWSTAEFGYLRLADGYVQGSSIMPQKRNPVALEHARALASRAFGEALAVFAAIHNTPFGDIVDTEDDLQPLVSAAFRDARRAVDLVAAAMDGASFDRERMARRAAEGGITLTELADTLVREHGLPFGAAHAIAARLSADVAAGRFDGLAASLAAAAREVIGSPIEMTEAQIEEVLSPGHFVDVRITPGGPAPAQVTRALADTASALDRRGAWLAGRRAALNAAEAKLSGRCGEL